MPRYTKYLSIAGLTVAVVVLATSVGIKLTSTTAFCLSCHEMSVYQKELALSPHAQDAKGMEITCTSCHVPETNIVRMLTAKSYMGIKDLWVHNTEEHYKLDRAAMQVQARRFIDDANCLACHQDLTKNAKNNGPVSAEGKLAHDAFLGKNGESRSGCAGCHINLAHLPKFDERIPRNAKFLSKLKESRP